MPARDILVSTQLLPTVQRTAEGTANNAINLLSGGPQQISNHALPTMAQRLGEAANKTVKAGNITDFSALSANLGLASKGLPGTFLVDSTTGTPLQQLTVSNDADLLPVQLVKDQPIADTAQLKVKLSASNALGTQEDTIVLTVMPTIQEGQSAEYVEFNPVHHPGSILKYRKTSGRSWTVSGKLISRTREEAEQNLRYLNIIRSWVMPQYGSRTVTATLGAPPPIITLEAFGPRMIGPVKCVLENFGWTFPNDVDYIPTFANEPFPVILDISLNLKESWAPSEFSSFNLAAYRQGNLFGNQNSAFYYVPTQVLPPTGSKGPPIAAGTSVNFVAGNNAIRRVDQAIAAAPVKQVFNDTGSKILSVQDRVGLGQSVAEIASTGTIDAPYFAP
jgi:hypothetical protein